MRLYPHEQQTTGRHQRQCVAFVLLDRIRGPRKRVLGLDTHVLDCVESLGFVSGICTRQGLECLC